MADLSLTHGADFTEILRDNEVGGESSELSGIHRNDRLAGLAHTADFLVDLDTRGPHVYRGGGDARQVHYGWRKVALMGDRDQEAQVPECSYDFRGCGQQAYHPQLRLGQPAGSVVHEEEQAGQSGNEGSEVVSEEIRNGAQQGGSFDQ